MSHLIRTLNSLANDVLIRTVTFMSHLIRTLNSLANDLFDSDRYVYVTIDSYLE